MAMMAMTISISTKVKASRRGDDVFPVMTSPQGTPSLAVWKLDWLSKTNLSGIAVVASGASSFALFACQN